MSCNEARRTFLWLMLLVGSGLPIARGAPIDANRLTYLDGNDPFYVGRDFPKLTTPQWIGEPGVDAVVVLAVDDMRVPERYEVFLRPILDRLKRLNGRAPLSIYCNALTVTNPLLAGWLQEGVSLEVHTLSHPCPLLARGNFGAAAETYHGGVDLVASIAGNHPVAFRMPCCDSMNSPSPRFYAEIFNQVSAAGHFLTLDSSVMNVFTSGDPELPLGLTRDAAGGERFRKYLVRETNALSRVSMASFVTTIENYPYPYVIGQRCWEFPAVVPSDWEANNFHGPTNEVTVTDWEAALEATVIKQGVMTFIFHPHGWIRSAQMVEFIDRAVAKYGGRIRFLNLQEAQDRLDRYLLAGNPIRSSDGGDGGVRLLDVNADGYLDVVVGNEQAHLTRVWQPAQREWRELAAPVSIVDAGGRDAGVRFGVLAGGPEAAMVVNNGKSSGAWKFTTNGWAEEPGLAALCRSQGLMTAVDGRDRGVRLRDVDHDGSCELIVGNETVNAVFQWSQALHRWEHADFQLPPGTAVVNADGRDAGLRFVDVDGDGYEDVLFSNEERFSLHQYIAKANPRLMWKVGWNDEVFTAKRGQADYDVPRIVRAGPHPNNGAWFHGGSLWVQNEDTAQLPDVVDRRSYRQLLTADQPQPKSASASLACLSVASNFTVELVASEPLTRDPIAFEWGADGKLWVVEMGDYPLGADNHGQPGGRVRYLEDTDGDGRYDKSTVFLDGLTYPTGVYPWRQGVIVSAAPDIFYAEDTDGDGRADRRETLFTGFVEGNPQHRLNGFDYGLDHWLYGANGDSGGEVKSAAHPNAPPISVHGRDFRFRPDTGQFEAIAGETQYGRHRDDWGNWFGNNNPVWLWHFFIEDRYVARNPQLLLREPIRQLANYANATRLFPTSRTRQRFNDHHQFNHVTSANSATPYRDDLFGPEFARAVFISDPVHNVVHREMLEPDGVSFTSHRARGEESSEFLSSSDNLFRPVMMKTGPDGALYVADFYRQVLEHPEWITKDIQRRLDFRVGADLGRIYRVFPRGTTLRATPNLARLGGADLVAAMDSANGWQRDTAQRLLIERAERAAAPALETLLRHGARPKARLQALATLDGLDAMTKELLGVALADTHPAVRRQALQVGERHGDWIRQPEIMAAIGRLAQDEAMPVRYQLALSAGEWPGTAISEILVQLARKDFEDEGMRLAILSSATAHGARMLEILLTEAGKMPPPPEVVEQLVLFQVAAGDDAALARTLGAIAGPAGGAHATWQLAGLAGFVDGLARRNIGYATFQQSASPELRKTMEALEPLFREAQATAAAPATDADARRVIEATRLLGRRARDAEEEIRLLAGLLRPQWPGPVQAAALRALQQSESERVADRLLELWPGLAPATREGAATALLSHPAWTRRLLDALEGGTVAVSELGAVQRQALRSHSDSAVRQRAERWVSAGSNNRKEVLEQYATVVNHHGDSQRGAALFRQHCVACHVLKGEGNAVGPDLGSLSAKPAEALLVAILDPNQAVEWRYVNYRATTKSGREVMGILSAETPNSITLRSAGAQEETILRSDLKEFESTRLSLMPEGFEAAFKVEDLADLIAWIQAN